jgi:hypothetical protein
MLESEFKMKKTSENSHISKAPKEIQKVLKEMKDKVASLTYSFTDDNNKITYFQPDVVVRIDKSVEREMKRVSFLSEKLDCNEEEARKFLSEMNDIK